jgi:hypothetical protein
MRVIQLRTARPAFADTLGKIREWLDGHGRPLVRFDTTTEGNTVIIKLTFDDDDLAEDFRQDFGGEAVG